MKKFLHKLPLPALMALCLVGCDNKKTVPANVVDPFAEAVPGVKPAYGPVDTVYVLNAVRRSYAHDVEKIWATNKQGDDFIGAFNMLDDVVFPAAGDEVVIVTDCHHYLYDYQIVKNLTAEKRKAEYINGK